MRFSLAPLFFASVVISSVAATSRAYFGAAPNRRSDKTIRANDFGVYIIYPEHPSDERLNKQVEERLGEIAGRAQVFTGRTDRVLLWSGRMNAAEAATARKTPGVRAVHEDRGATGPLPDTAHKAIRSAVSSTHGKRGDSDSGYIRQKGDIADLAATSQPKDTEQRQYSDYAFHESAAEGIWVYSIEDGVIRSKELSRVQTVQTPRAKSSGVNPDMERGIEPHGSCVMSKAVGQDYGIAKKASLVAVQQGADSRSEFLFALVEAYNHITSDDDRKRKSVVSITLQFEDEFNDNGEFDVFKETMGILFDQFVKADVPVIMAAGNSGLEPGHNGVDRYPQLFAGEKPLIAVSAVDATGVLLPKSQRGRETTIYAAGEGSCSVNGVRYFASGTSQAQAVVTGVVAYWLGMPRGKGPQIKAKSGEFVKELIKYMQSDDGSWARKSGLRMIWNGVTEDQYEGAEKP
ncbi:Uu.00g089220.m01.CDS01 [Anthostomella pinea]|uniref:Uu.00g089220.m01.CDS01 n=1 Tax=Anthostomella pinea TaxID=933095 RepID=A0AAI8VNL0_9PEZI|nr:Uu.00g089220.m01.CDS01 [Anthostomella pinea]